MFLYQHSAKFTCYIYGHDPQDTVQCLLDVILANEKGMINEIQYIPPQKFIMFTWFSILTCTYRRICMHIQKNMTNQELHFTGEIIKKKITENLMPTNQMKIMEDIHAENAWTLFKEVLSQKIEKDIQKAEYQRESDT